MLCLVDDEKKGFTNALHVTKFTDLLKLFFFYAHTPLQALQARPRGDRR